MFNLEETLNSILVFISKYFRTFSHSIFSPSLFINNILRKREIYADSIMYLFISVIIVYSSARALSGLFEFKDEIGGIVSALNEIGNKDTFEIIFIAAPVCYVAWLLIRFLAKLLVVPQSWKQYFISIGIYWFSSVQILIGILVFSTLLFQAFMERMVKSRVSSEIYMNIQFSVEPVVIPLTIFVLLLPVAAVFKRFFKKQIRLFLRFFVLSLLCSASFLLLLKPFELIDYISSVFKPDDKNKVIKININSTHMNDVLIFKIDSLRNDSIRISTDILIENISDKVFSIIRSDHFNCNFYDNHNRYRESIKFVIKEWEGRNDIPVMVLKYNDIKWVCLTIVSSDTAILNKILKRSYMDSKVSISFSRYVSTKTKSFRYFLQKGNELNDLVHLE